VPSLISGFHRKVDGNCTLLLSYAASSGNFLPTFRDNLSVHLQDSGIQKEIILDFLTPKVGPIGCPETLVRNYHYLLCNNPEECNSQCPVFQKPKVHSHTYNVLLLGHIVSAGSVHFTFSEQFICISFRFCVVL
jgi:hypothetical protein